MELHNWYVSEVWYCDQEGWNTWMVTPKNEQGDCLAESEHFYRKGDALRCARGYLNRGRCRYMSVYTKIGVHQYKEATTHGEAKKYYAMKRREAHGGGMKVELTTDLSLELRKTFNSHAGQTFWKVWLYDEATGLSLEVGEAYYSSKHKAKAGFEEALGFFRRTLPIKKEAA